MLPSRKKSSSRLNLGFVATELAILVVLLIGLATGSVLVQQNQNPQKKAAIQQLSFPPCRQCNSNNVCISNPEPCMDANECDLSCDCTNTCNPTPKPTDSYTCNGDCIPDGENCWRSGTGSCQSNFFCCKQQDPDPTVSPTKAPTKTPTRTPTRVPTKTPTKSPTPGCSPLGRKRCGGLDRNGNSCGTSGINVCYSNGWICTDCPGDMTCDRNQTPNICITPTPPCPWNLPNNGRRCDYNICGRGKIKICKSNGWVCEDCPGDSSCDRNLNKCVGPTPLCSPIDSYKCGDFDQSGKKCSPGGILRCKSNGWVCEDCRGDTVCDKRQNKCVVPTPLCSPYDGYKCGEFDSRGKKCSPEGILWCRSQGWICEDCPGFYSCDKKQNKCVSPTPVRTFL